MGLDIYVGSLTRYFAGDWQTVAAQAAAAEGIEFTTVRPGEVPVADTPEAIWERVAQWQAAMGAALGFDGLWADDPDAPYATDQPHWLGYGALLVLAAQIEHPDLADEADSPQDFAASRAFEAAKQRGSELFPSLIGGAEWWLPIDGIAATFTGTSVDGATIGMGTLDLLAAELEMLRERLGVDGAALTEALLTGGPLEEPTGLNGDHATYLREWGVFALAVFLELTGQARRMSLPLLLDY